MMLAKTLIVEDQDLPRDLLVFYFSQNADIVVHEATSLQQAIPILREGVFDCVVLDLFLKDSQGIATLEAIQQVTSALVVVYTASDNKELEQEAIEKGAAGWVNKDMDSMPKLRKAVALAIARKQGLLDGDTKSILVLKSAKQAAIAWGMSGAGGVALWLVLIADWHSKVFIQHIPYVPPPEVWTVLTSTLGIGAYGLAKRK